MQVQSRENYLDISLLGEDIHRVGSTGGLLTIGTVTGNLLSMSGGTSELK